MSESAAKRRREQLFKVASKAAEEATTKERARCLWVLDDILEDLRRKMPKVIRIENQRHMQETKIKIAMAVQKVAANMIISGVEPPEESDESS